VLGKIVQVTILFVKVTLTNTPINPKVVNSNTT